MKNTSNEWVFQLQPFEKSKGITKREHILNIFKNSPVGLGARHIIGTSGILPSTVYARIKELFDADEIYISSMDCSYNTSIFPVRIYKYKKFPFDKSIRKFDDIDLLKHAIDSLYPLESNIIYDEFNRLKEYRDRKRHG